MNDLRLALRDAVATLRTETGRDLEQLFGERLLEPEQMTPSAAHASESSRERRWRWA